MILFTKGDLIQLIRNMADFNLQGCLWDSPHNLQRMAQMQDDMLACCNVLNTFTRLYGGLVSPEYMVAGGPGSPGQLKKFYAPLPLLPTVESMDEEEVDTLIECHFKMGMSKFELGQFLITVGCKVDLTKFGRQLLQHCERGMQQSEPATGRRGLTLQIQQISEWWSIFGSEHGEPALLQLLGGFDETIPTTMIIQHKRLAFKKPFILVQKF